MTDFSTPNKVESQTTTGKNGIVNAETQYTRLGAAAIYTTEQIIYQLGKYGVILFKNGAKDTSEFSQLVQEHSPYATLDPACSTTIGVAQLVESQFDCSGLRCVNGNSPFWAEQAWFYCQQAEGEGSPIRLCDGVALWQNLHTKTQKYFIQNDICYERVVEADKWKRLVKNQYPDIEESVEVEFEHLKKMLDDRSDCNVHLLENENIYYRLVVPAIQTSRFNNQLAFANNILGASGYYQTPKISLARSGYPIDEQILDEIAFVSETISLQLYLQPHDILLLDNYRVMYSHADTMDQDHRVFNAISHV